jgi:dipeptidyl aminopeptidase/acylaminoacyl peptidase
LTTPDPKRGERNHAWPRILPGGEAVLFTIGGAGSFDDAKIAVLNLQTRGQRVLVEGGTSPHYVPGPSGGAGHLLYWRAASLFAVPFHLGKLQVTGSPVPVLEGVAGVATAGHAHFSVSDAGTLVYLPGGSTEGATRNLVWVDRDGKEQPLGAPARDYSLARLSPDGQRVAVSIGARAGQSDIWLYDLPRGTLTRLTFHGDNDDPVWTPDGKRVTFRSTDAGKTTFSWVPADGSGPPEPLVAVDGDPIPYSWSPDGKLLAFRRTDAKGRDIWLMPAEGQRTPRRWMETQFDKETPRFSPDGRWLAYASGGGASVQVFVQAAPAGGATGTAGARWQVSVEGGASPRWSRDGRELFYRWGGKLMSAPIDKGATFRAGTPRALLETRGYGLAAAGDYDVSPDGKRFLFLKAEGVPDATSGGQQQFQFVLEWFDEVRRRVEAGAAQ